MDQSKRTNRWLGAEPMLIPVLDSWEATRSGFRRTTTCCSSAAATHPG